MTDVVRCLGLPNLLLGWKNYNNSVGSDERRNPRPNNPRRKKKRLQKKNEVGKHISNLVVR